MTRPASRQYRAIADFYDAEYTGGYVLDDDVPFLLRQLTDPPQRVLELCCGTGRAAIPIARAGHHVVGIDIDPALLEIADRKRKAVTLDGHSLRFECGDALTFTAGEPFDWITLLFNTFLNFTTLEEQDRLLRRFRDSLRAGGTLWLDVFHPDPRILAVPHWPRFDSATFFVPALGQNVNRTTEIKRSKSRPRVQEMTFHYAYSADGGEVIKRKIRFDMTWMFPHELRAALDRNGFSVTHEYGDYDASPVVAGSPRIIMAAKKR